MKLFDACRNHGHFLLDLRDSHSGGILLEEAAFMMANGRETLDLDQKILGQLLDRPLQRMLGYVSPLISYYVLATANLFAGE